MVFTFSRVWAAMFNLLNNKFVKAAGKFEDDAAGCTHEWSHIEVLTFAFQTKIHEEQKE